MVHLLLHVLVPVVVALAVYRPRWGLATGVMVATMVVDFDHLLADPIYDPNRCSIGFHPLHEWPVMLVYGLMFALPILRRGDRRWLIVHLFGLGLLIHMVLDGLDCLA